MKKIYSKPDILFDSFAMADSIASCEVQANFQSGTCGVVLTEAMTLFTQSVADCNWQFKDEEYDGLCYHVPFGAYNVFNS